MNDYLKNITPDSFSGEVFAFEGIRRAITVINGPSGCKFYHSAISDSQNIGQTAFDPLNYPRQWYFGQPRVPCTYLDTKDYVYGSHNKLTEAVQDLCNKVPFDLLCVVNSPGAALIGDDISAIIKNAANKPFITIESPGFSENICGGYENAVKQLITQLGLKKNISAKKDRFVNILGLSIFHKYYAGDIQELRRLFSLCGIEINCFVCADCDPDSLRRIPEASLNIVLYPEYGISTAKMLESEYGTPCYICNGPPVGFSATEKMMTDICGIFGIDTGPFQRESEQARIKAYVHISRVNSLTGLPKAVPFSVEGTCSEVYAYTLFLVRHFGMILETASVLNNENSCFKKTLHDLLNELKMIDALKRDILDTQSELVFASGNTIAALKMRSRAYRFSGIEISLPSLGYLDILPKTHMGLTGALMLTEQVLNGLMFI